MLKYDFDTVVDRTHNLSIKYDRRLEKFGNDQVIPLWVADMDFKTAQPVIDALTRRAQEGIWGYTARPERYYEAVMDWQRRRHNWTIRREQLSWTPGVVPALYALVELFTPPRSKVLIQTPVYPNFYTAAERCGRTVLESPLVARDGQWSVDWVDFEDKLSQASLFLLCSPHNPLGRVWTREELTRMTDLCRKHRVLLVSDEIHADLIFHGKVHVPTASLSPQTAGEVVTCISATKTFNLAGLEFSTAVIPDAGLRQRFIQTMQAYGSCAGNLLSRMAQRTAYQQGIPWLEGLLAYLDDARRMLREVLERDFPGVEMSDLQGTYLAWLDFTAYTQDPQRLWQWAAQAGVAVGKGHEFMGPGFARFNLACPHAQLLESLDRLHAALPQLRESR